MIWQKKRQGKDYVVLSVVAPTFNGEKSEADFKNWYQSLDYKDFPVLLDSKGRTCSKSMGFVLIHRRSLLRVMGL